MRFNHIKLLAIGLLTLGMLAGCNPIDDNYEPTDTALTADELQLSATAKTVNGKHTNEIVVENHSPIPSEWTIEQMGTNSYSSTKSCDVLYATKTGENKIKFRGYNASTNTYAEKTLPVQVDVITHVPVYLSERLCIGQQGAPTTFGTEIDYSKIQIIVEKDANGLNGNRITLINSNPVLTKWDFGGETSDKNIATLYVLRLGDIPLKATFTLANGETVTHEFDPVKVNTYTYKPEFLVNLTGGDKGEQAWTWVASPKLAYGLGGYMSATVPEWAHLDLATVGALGQSVGHPNEGEGATMTFKLTGELILSSGRKGTWSFDLTKGVPGWSIGKLYTKDVSVLYGHGFDTKTYVGPEIHEYDIVVSTSGELTLCAANPGNAYQYGLATFFCFSAVK